MKAVKFNFGRDFDDVGETAAELEARTQALALSEAREEGRAEGHLSGQAEAKTAIETEIAGTMVVVAERLEALLASSAEMEDRLERQAVQLSLSLARKIAGVALAKFPDAELMKLVGECLEVYRDEKRLVIRVAEHLTDETAARCEQLKSRSSFAGDLIIIGDPEIAAHDCVVEWPDGGAERNANQTSAEVERLIQDFVMRQMPGGKRPIGEMPSQETPSEPISEPQPDPEVVPVAAIDQLEQPEASDQSDASPEDREMD